MYIYIYQESMAELLPPPPPLLGTLTSNEKTRRSQRATFRGTCCVFQDFEGGINDDYLDGLVGICIPINPDFLLKVG